MDLLSQPAPVCHADPATAPVLPALRIGYERCTLAAALAEADVMAVIGFGSGAPAAHDPRYLRVALEPVAVPAPLEVWRGCGPVERGRDGDIAWASDSDYSFGAIELDEAAHGGIAAATRHAYQALGAWCRASATPHILRIWNYLDAINLGVGDNERYRQFCSGRAAGIGTAAAIEDAAAYPAATAVGVRDGRRVVQVYWLTARRAGTPLENPRQLNAWRYPRQYGAAAPSFARAMRAPTHSPQLYISGTAAIIGYASHHPGDGTAQLDETLANLDSLFAAARIGGTRRFGSRSIWKIYLRHATDAPHMHTRLRECLGADTPWLLLHGDICRAELLVEIDGVQNG
jgi:chorismate lyase/3-hydroxybenzoate synthase